MGSGLSDPAPLRWMRQEPWLESAITFPFCELHCLGSLLSSHSGIRTSGITLWAGRQPGNRPRPEWTWQWRSVGCQRAGSPSPGGVSSHWDREPCLAQFAFVSQLVHKSSQRENEWNTRCCIRHVSRSVMSDSLPLPPPPPSGPPSTIARQAPLSMGFCRKEHWSGLPCPPPGDLPNPGIEPRYVIYLQKMLAVISSSHVSDSKAMHLLPRWLSYFMLDP